MKDGRIAIVGIGCRVPGARDAAGLWDIVRSGRSMLRDLTQQELDALDPASRSDPRYVARGGFIDGIEEIDAGFFGLTPGQAQMLDPQHRLFFECAWEALEDARRTPASLDNEIGVYAGSSISAYLLFNLLPGLQSGAEPATLLAMTGNDKDYLASHLAFLLGLRGPTVGVQTACSSSLAAVHLACQALRAGDCALALAGGVSVRVPQHAGYLHVEGSILSPSGACRSFDARADGTVFASGCAVLALRRLEDALRDGDEVLAVIAGSAMNNDGQRKSGFTAPSVDGQAAVITAALRAAGLQPADLQQVEAHGTGTPIGDPIEMQALREALGDSGPSVGIGCAKASFGHLEAAAGAVGLVAAVMALRARQRPPLAGFGQPNPLLPLQGARFDLDGRLRNWPAPAAGHPRRCGVSSFGIGGTNVHVVLEEPPADHGAGDELLELTLGPDSVPTSNDPAAPQVVLNVSGRSAAACAAARDALIAMLHDGCDLAAIGRTTLLGRQAFEHRIAVAVRDADEARRALAAAPMVAVPERPRLAIHWCDGSVPVPAAQLTQFDLLQGRHAALTAAGLAPVLQAGSGVGAWAALAAAGAGWEPVRAVLKQTLFGEPSAASALAQLLAGLPTSAPALLLQGMSAPLRAPWQSAARALLAALATPEPLVRCDGGGATVLLLVGPGPAPDTPLPLVADAADSTVTLAALQSHGVAIDWRALLPVGPMARLPSYPFQRERAWREPPARTAVALAPVAAGWPPVDPVDTPLAARAWRARVTAQAPVWLGQHVVGGQVLMPAAAWLAAALRAAPQGLAGLELLAPLPIPPEGVEVQVSLDNDGTGTIHARLAGGWERQAVFRAGAAAAGALAGEDLATLHRRCPQPLSPSALQARMSGHGITLGPALQLHTQVQAGDGEALARLAVGSGTPGDTPVLDALFQTLAAAVGPVQTGHLPVALAEVELAPGAAASTPVWCHARLLPPATDGSLIGDLALLDVQGQVLLRVRGLRCRPIAPTGADASPDSLDLLQLAWREDLIPALPAPRPVSATGIPWAPAHLQALAALDALCCAWLVRALNMLDAVPPPGMPLEPRLRSVLAPTLTASLPRLLRMLREDGWLDANGCWTPRPAADAQDLHARFLQDHPGLAHEAQLLARCGQALAGVLRGTTEPVDLLFGVDAQDPAGAQPATDLYHGSRYLDALHALARQALAPLAQVDTPLQVLEVGGGTGSITGHVLDALGDRVAGYCFTDVSHGFLARARQQHGARAGFSTALFDLEQPPATQGIGINRHGLAVAANVLHATRDLRVTLRHLRATLQPGGWLLLVEGLRPTRWLDLTFGLTPGWWRSADGLRGSDGPLLDAKGWLLLLDAEDWGDVQLLTLGATEGRLADQAVLLARRVDRNGDVVPVCDVGLRAGDPAAAVLADLQERLAVATTDRLLVLTRGAQAVRPWDQPEPAQAAVAGLVKAIARERPQLALRVVDLDPLADGPQDLQRVLAAEAARAGDEPESAWRDGVRWLPRLVTAQAGAVSLPYWRLAQNGPGLQALMPQPMALPEPGPGEVRIAVHAAGLNFKDVLLAIGALGPQPSGAGLGGECAGVVDALGPGVTGLQPGDAVVGLGGGTFASHVVLPTLRVAPLPPSLSMAQAAALPIAAMTALHALDEIAALTTGQTVVVHAGSGGVGHHAIALARARGARVVATAGSASKRAYLCTLGVSDVADSRSTEFSDVVRAATAGRGADVVLNCLTGDAIEAGFACLRPGGLFIEIGRAGTWTPEEAARRHPKIRYVQVALDRLDDAQGARLLRRVMAAAAEGMLATPPLSVFGPAQAPAAYRLMQQARHVGRLVLVQPALLPLRRDRTYLVSGGVGGLGLELAQWALQRGAGHLVLLARGGPGPQVQARLDGWRADGHDVRVLAADVANAADLQRVRAQLAREELPPVAALFHAAGVLDDARFEHQNAQRMARVCMAKLEGAQQLHAHWPGVPLVAFGSAASLLGSAGQANHAAASAALDAFVLRQRGRGIPALTVDWGAWAEVGAAARRQVGARLAGTGMREIVPSRGLQALAWALGQPGGQWAVLPLDRAALAAAGPVPALLRELADAPTPAQTATEVKPPHRSAEAGPVSTLAGNLAALPAGARLRHLVQRVQAEVAAVLGSPDLVAPAQPLTEAGIDSLLAIDLRNRLASCSGLALPGTLLFDHPTIDALAAHLLQLLAPDAQPLAPVPQPSDPSDDVHAGDDDLAALLAELERKHLE